VFTRSGSTWTQQGAKLTPKSGEEIGEGLFGYYMALSSDGNTVLISGASDNNYVGAAGVFTRAGAVWTQQGAKLTAKSGEEIGAGLFGVSVALSSDGNTALIGGPNDNNKVGAAWVFTRSGAVWTQQGTKLTAKSGEEIGAANFGFSVALSADANIALIAGPNDNTPAGQSVGVGAAWVFVPLTPPENTAAPTISGTPQQGNILTAVNGSWTNSPTSYGYQWQRCDASGNNCAAIAGATGQTYALTAADVGSMIRVRETASNEAGAGTPASSSPVGAVIIAPPENTAAPTISGTAQQGRMLTAVDGSWTNSPTSVIHQWQRCDSSANSCAAIPGATGQTYALTAADVGSMIRVRETASNAAGSGAPATSTQTAVVQAPPSSSGGGSSAGGAGAGTGSDTSSGGAPAGTGTAHTAKPLTQAQKLAKAIKACHKLKHSKRAKCLEMAKKRYPLGKPKAHKKTRKRKG
jgi:hypothetical protein